ncbi:MAG: hypothetical protein JWO15_502 [Sphingomonadales bacterium]|nr:hypothetical protein [Sphingomonadales bacterium]
MIEICITALALVALTFMSARANRKFRHERRLPMQWSVSGLVNWTAPRPLALAFTPLLAGALLVTTTFSTLVLPPHPGQESLGALVIAIMSISFIAAHALHLWLIDRMLNRNGS